MTGSAAGGGLRHLRVYELDDLSYPLVPASGATGYRGHHLNVAKAFTPNFPEPTIIQISGDDRAQGQITLAPSEMVSAEIRTGNANLDIDALLSGVKSKSFAGGKLIGRGTNKEGAGEAEVALLAFQQFLDTKKTSPTKGQTFWHYYLIPLAKVFARPGGLEEGNAYESSYNVQPQTVTRPPWGPLFTEADDGFTEAQTLEGILSGPPMLESWLGDGTVTEFTLGETARNNTDIKVFHYNGTTVTDVSATVTLSTTSVTFSAAPAADDIIIAFYPLAVVPGA